MSNIAHEISGHNNFWRFIEDYLPNYSSRDDVLCDDILTRYMEGEDVCEEDLAWIGDEFNYDMDLVKKELVRIESRFAQEALSAYYKTCL